MNKNFIITRKISSFSHNTVEIYNFLFDKSLLEHPVYLNRNKKCTYLFLYTIGLNVFCEFIGGLIMPGNPIGNVTFKVYGYIAQSQAICLLGALKLGHYMKVYYNYE
jgi:hypothetical protein